MDGIQVGPCVSMLLSDVKSNLSFLSQGGNGDMGKRGPPGAFPPWVSPVLGNSDGHCQ